ncbi:MAG TPA: hypothetical protein V6C96_00105 [Vampirovibrionales bacterium]
MIQLLKKIDLFIEEDGNWSISHAFDETRKAVMVTLSNFKMLKQANSYFEVANYVRKSSEVQIKYNKLL